MIAAVALPNVVTVALVAVPRRGLSPVKGGALYVVRERLVAGDRTLGADERLALDAEERPKRPLYAFARADKQLFGVLRSLP